MENCRGQNKKEQKKKKIENQGKKQTTNQSYKYVIVNVFHSSVDSSVQVHS